MFIELEKKAANGFGPNKLALFKTAGGRAESGMGWLQTFNPTLGRQGQRLPISVNLRPAYST